MSPSFQQATKIHTWRGHIVLWFKAYRECLEEQRPVSLVKNKPLQQALF